MGTHTKAQNKQNKTKQKVKRNLKYVFLAHSIMLYEVGGPILCNDSFSVNNNSLK